MALYIGEEEVWKCPKHPSKRHRNGICPTCLRDRLGILCPDCHNTRPCSCCTTATSSSSSSFGRVFSSFSSSARATTSADSHAPTFQKSRSVAAPFTRSRFSSTSMRENSEINNINNNNNNNIKVKTTSFWSSFRRNKSRKGEIEGFKGDLVEGGFEENSKIGDFERMMVKSRSMRAPISLEKSTSTKGKLWQFPSPIRVFRDRSKVVQERSPLQRF